MEYRVICTDIDGTLLNKNRELSEATIKEISRIKDEIPVILVSSRMPKAMRHLQNDLGIKNMPIISYNGALVLLFDKEENPVKFISIPIDFEVLKLIYKITRNTTLHLSIYRDDDWFVESIDYWASREINNTKVSPIVKKIEEVLQEWEYKKFGPHKIMCMGAEDEISILEKKLTLDYSNKLNIYRSKPTYLELSSSLISKATAIEKLLTEKFDFKLSEAVAFGDNYNDIEMLEAVGLGIAVANANETLKSIADEITFSNVEDGVAASIKKYFS